MPALGQDGLGVELHAFDGQVPVAESHDDASAGAARHDERRRHGLGHHGQRVVAGGDERVGEPRIERPAVVVDERGHPVHELGGVIDCCTERRRDGLVTEAHPEEWDAAIRGRKDRGDRRTGASWGARAGRDEHPVVAGDPLGCFGRRDRVGLDEDGVGPELVKVPDERVDEAVVVVDDEDPGHSTVTSCGAR